MKTLIWDRGKLIPTDLCIDEILRFGDEDFWRTSSNLTVYKFTHYVGDYLDDLFSRYPSIQCYEISGDVTIGEHEGHPVIAQREHDHVYLHLHKREERILLLYARCDQLYPTVTSEGSDIVWDSFDVARELWRAYGRELCDKWRSQSSYIALDDISVISTEIFGMISERNFKSALLFADCMCQVAESKGDEPMRDYFAKIRDGLQSILVVDV